MRKRTKLRFGDRLHWREFQRPFTHLVRVVVPAMLVSIAPSAQSGASESVSAESYPFRVYHKALAIYPLERHRSGVEMQVRIFNGGERNLGDLRVTLMRAGAAQLAQCAPVSVHGVEKGTEGEFTWTFECRGRVPVKSEFHAVRFRIEAIDETTQKIVSFIVSSREVS